MDSRPQQSTASPSPQPLIDQADGGAGSTKAAAASRRSDAFRVHGALLDAVSAAVYERVVAAAAAGLPVEVLPPRYEGGGAGRAPGGMEECERGCGGGGGAARGAGRGVEGGV